MWTVPAVVETLIKNIVARVRAQIAMSQNDAGSNFRNTGTNHSYKFCNAALNSVMRSFAGDPADRGVTVIAMQPGGGRTAMGGAQSTLDPDQSVACRTRRNGLKPSPLVLPNIDSSGGVDAPHGIGVPKWRC
jgi:NAD(P)-dependent dehydrogenase (short-subunit alcohol dehydrogenase family)